ncbi:alpha-D-ribose 1-methylphosphonate 5-triphosphate diphosphatase [Actibacterium sp. 188UL27-1]|uniref:alpha-D-ribose 1-methylphosphonate 5-triphosphate diphosphatase n=1 Tax=Actibacterium sp. 188UL27-1 TaxID=2786961 RepID=UPI00195762F2|nr:alpha-D-ribose 1-methylphosphonate 5-triphosphate diphosphatase [Actibacterium sp. 188UL27-1]MBM7068870.1 alpha-D-ribose 1-methylphosphonate 5-triphosphate diphosphatase [Actibacterium sp. 188UL27-1]
MLDKGETGIAVRIEGARVLVGHDVVETSVTVANGKIAEIGGGVADRSIDGRGLFLAPALVDIHGDAFERQVMPRPKVFFPMDAAILDTDRQLAGNGIATAYHALTLSWEPGLRAVDRGEAFLNGLAALQGRLTVENRVQLRWETFAFEALDLIKRALEAPLLPSIAFNDHTSMTMRDYDVPVQTRLFEHAPDFAILDPSDPRFARKTNNYQRAGMSPEDYGTRLLEIWERRPDVPGVMADVAARGRVKGAPMLSHDDTQVETRDFYRGLGACISEFPMQTHVAQSARDNGDHIIFGAPNVVRGGSHIGSPSAADMVEAGLCDALASDYFYPAMLAAVARLNVEKRAPLPRLWSLVSRGPAVASGLTDRGEIAPGKRADLVLVDWPTDGTPAIRMTMSAGCIAYGTGF